MGSRDLRWMKTAAQNRKHGRSAVLEKEMFFGYIWTSTEKVDGSKTEKAQEPTAGSLNAASPNVQPS